jgi:hypothetical protein
MSDLQMQKHRIHNDYEPFGFESRMFKCMKSEKLVFKQKVGPLTVLHVKKRQELFPCNLGMIVRSRMGSISLLKKTRYD